MRVRKRRNSLREAPARTGPNGARWNEAPTTSANAWQVASLNQPPDGRTRDAECASSLFDGDHFGGHMSIVSQPSHRLSRLSSRHSRAEFTGRTINGKEMDHRRIDEIVKRSDVEIWRFVTRRLFITGFMCTVCSSDSVTQWNDACDLRGRLEGHGYCAPDGDFTWYSGLFGDNRPQPSAVVAIGGSTGCHLHQNQAANHARCRCCSSSTPTLRLANALPPR
jgi:hypothetical protein